MRIQQPFWASSRSFMQEKPTVTLSIALALIGPVLLWGVYPYRRSNGAVRPVDAPLSYPLPQRERVLVEGFEDE